MNQSLLGQHIGEWLLTRVLGEGGMSIVYAGRHIFQEEEVAIKLLRPELSEHSELLHRFQREAQTIQQLNHPNIITLHDFGEDPEHGFFMVLELLEGQDLKKVFQQKTPQPIDWMLSITEQLCAALQATHEAGVVHRDLKPSNIFLVPNEPYPTVKLLDFGVARTQFLQDETRLTHTGVVVGTPAYLAPEQLLAGKTITDAVDIYSLGVIWFEAMTGKLPIESGKQVELMVKSLQEEPKRLGDYRPDLRGSSLEELLQRCLAKKPENRPFSMVLLWDEFEIACQFLDEGPP